MDNNSIRIICAAYYVLLLGVCYLWRKERTNRRYWRHPSLVLEEGEYNTLFTYYKENCHDRFFRYCRMEVWQFDELLNLLRRRLSKRSRRQPVPPEERLAMTLRFLAHGGDLVTLAESYRRGQSTAQKIVKET
ncbi:Lipoprotein-releasing system ATP-binding protein LolD [Frankliniella fusca]|nr:Lipoprotein-releasing system ATP-binding protein LolD [Frankliniella fusca]